MSPELAQQLKDAGFPQHDTLPFDAYEPTLEELMDACGEKLHCLVYTTNGGIDGDTKYWSAGVDNKVINWHNAKTRREAVAYLYLALKKDGVVLADGTEEN